MSEDKTITIKKSDLWKYSTFVLVAVLIVGSVIVFTGGSGIPSGNATNNGGNTGGAVDTSVFLKNSDLFPSLGPKDADNVVIELSDFQCPWCALASGLPSWANSGDPLGSQLISQSGDLVNSAKNAEDAAANGDIRFVYVSLSFLGPESVYAAQAGLCANQQGKFWELHDAIFAKHDSHENNGKYSKANLKTLAAGISGLNQNDFASCLDNDETLSDVQRATATVQSAGIAIGTPQFFVNGQQVTASWNAIQSAFK